MSAHPIGWRASLGPLGAACIAALFLHAPAALAAEWIIDPERGCGTTSLFTDENESIRWFGGCRDGKLDGPGVLIWYQGGIETERDEGTFREGELDGEAVIRLANGVSVFGAYRAGVRHGDFVIVRADGATIHSVYDQGRLVSEEIWTASKAAAWREAREAALTARRGSPARASKVERRAAVPATEETAVLGDPAPRAAPAAPDATAPESMETAALGDPASRPAPAAPEPARLEEARATAPEAARAVAIDEATAAAAEAGPKQRFSLALYLAPESDEARPIAIETVFDRTVIAGSRPHGVVLKPPAGPVLAPAPAPAAPLQEPIRLREPPAPPRQPAQERLELAAVAPARPAPASEVIALHLDGVDVREAAAVILGQVLNLPYLIDEGVSGTVALPAGHRVARRDLLPTLQALLRPHGAALVARGAGYRIVSVRAAAPGPRVEGPRSRLGTAVCTQKGLYANDAKWCGLVRGEDARYLEVEVVSISLNAFLAIGLQGSACTGDRFIGYLSRGKRIKVPEACMGPPW